MAKKKKRRIRFRWVLAISVLLAGGFVWATNSAVLSSSDGKIYTNIGQVPSEPTGLVLGTSPMFHGHKNPYFEARMNAAAKLYKAGKVTRLLASGDNHTAYYDEPTAMKRALVSRGVPDRAIILDYAGLRTLDSIIRAHKVFGVDRCVIVTDDFHLPRALYIATNEDVDAIGYQTAELPASVSPWTHFREIGARSLVWVDIHILNRQPKFLGKRESL